MTPLLSVPLALALTALLGLALLAALVGTVLLLLLAALALDVLLERNGVDRRAGVLRLWRRLRRPAPVVRRPEASSDAPADRTAPRIPFSARRPTRPARQEPADEPMGTAESPEPSAGEPVAPESPAVVALTETPTPVSDAVTEVLVVPEPPAPRVRAPRSPRVPRPTPRRTPEPQPGPAPEPAPVDRDSAIDRLFAPLLETDRTEPLPRATRPVKRPRDDT